MIDTLDIAQTDTDELKVTMRGDVATITKTLIYGVGNENLQALLDALNQELERRRIAKETK